MVSSGFSALKEAATGKRASVLESPLRFFWTLRALLEEIRLNRLGLFRKPVPPVKIKFEARGVLLKQGERVPGDGVSTVPRNIYKEISETDRYCKSHTHTEAGFSILYVKP